jgi:hypothetical protein
MAQIIHYVDLGEFYSVYGIATMIVFIMLLWFFVRSNIEEQPKIRYRYYEPMINSYSVGQLTELSQTNKSDKFLRREGMFPIEDSFVLDHFPEFNEELPKPPQQNYNLKKGTYGGVPVYVYDLKDADSAADWADTNTNIYVPNMRTAFRSVSTPIQASYWKK